MVICRFIVFPGNFYIFRRFSENAFGKSLARRNARNLNALYEFVRYFENWDLRDVSKLDVETIKGLFRYLKEQQQCFNYINENYKISPFQLVYRSQLNSMISSAESLTISFDGVLDQQYTIMDLLQKPMIFLKSLEKRMTVNDPTELHELMHQVQQLQIFSARYLTENKAQAFNNLLYNSTFGSLNELRAYIQLEYHTHRITLTSADGHKIDAMFVMRDENYQRYVTMLFCNPNGAYYESLFHDTHWAQFYIQHGMNLFLWNYRGYGESQGTPDPHKLSEDGEMIVNYIRQNLKCGRIGVHGYSLGGYLACHLAKVKKLDFLFADRTFCSLAAVGEKSFGTKLALLFNIVTNWEKYIPTDYLDFQGEKCLAFDPNDEIIPMLASLPVGVIIDYFTNTYKPSKTRSLSSLTLDKMVQNGPNFFKHKINTILKRYDSNLSEAFFKHILPQGDFNQLFASCERVLSIISDFYKDDPSQFQKPLIKPFLDEKHNEFLAESQDLHRESFLKDQKARHLSSPYFQLFMVYIYQTLHVLNNGVMSFTDIYIHQSHFRREQIMVFFIVGHYIGSSRWQDTKYSQAQARFIDQAQTLVETYQRISNPIIKSVTTFFKFKWIKDINNIVTKIKSIIENFEKKPNDTFDHIIDLADTNEKLKLDQSDYSEVLGNIFSVSCGHNGNYQYQELEKVTQILLHSKFMQ